MSVGVSKGGLPPDDCTESEDEILRDGERLIKEHHDKGPYAMIQIGLAPCAPFSVSTGLMKETAAQAKKWGVRMHTHLCETLDEEKYCLETYKLRPIDFLESLGWISDNAWLAHMKGEAVSHGRAGKLRAVHPCDWTPGEPIPLPVRGKAG